MDKNNSMMESTVVLMTDYQAMAELLFPSCTQTPQELEERYPKRQIKEGAKVCRFAPSPTGHMHLGNLFSSFVSERAAHTSGTFRRASTW